jgi:lysyl-tRNA synthetase class 2
VDRYPASQAALARLDPADPRVARRFEIYLDGIELANGFHELADPVEQRRRFAHDRALRRKAGVADTPPDEEFLAALAAGLPDCCGVAVGFYRLLMACLAAGDIREVVSFAVPTVR